MSQGNLSVELITTFCFMQKCLKLWLTLMRGLFCKVQVEQATILFQKFADVCQTSLFLNSNIGSYLGLQAYRIV